MGNVVVIVPEAAAMLIFVGVLHPLRPSAASCCVAGVLPGRPTSSTGGGGAFLIRTHRALLALFEQSVRAVEHAQPDFAGLGDELVRMLL